MWLFTIPLTGLPCEINLTVGRPQGVGLGVLRCFPPGPREPIQSKPKILVSGLVRELGLKLAFVVYYEGRPGLPDMNLFDQGIESGEVYCSLEEPFPGPPYPLFYADNKVRPLAKTPGTRHSGDDRSTAGIAQSCPRRITPGPNGFARP